MSGLIYFRDGDLVANSGDVSVYDMNDELFLEIGPGHTLWALEREIKDYIVQLDDFPRGNCLEIGLGLGVASRCILTYPYVDHLTTVELNSDVIKTHEITSDILADKSRDTKWLPYNKNRHSIINMSGLEYLYTTKDKYDFIFMDFWQHIDDDTLPAIADMAKAAKKVLEYDGKIIGWLDPHTTKDNIEYFEKIFNTKENDCD